MWTILVSFCIGFTTRNLINNIKDTCVLTCFTELQNALIEMYSSLFYICKQVNVLLVQERGENSTVELGEEDVRTTNDSHRLFMGILFMVLLT